MHNSYLLIVILITPFLILLVINQISMRRLLKQRLSIRRLDDERYFELKYKLEYITAIAAVVAAVATFIGIDSKQAVEDNILKIEKLNDSIGSLKEKAKGFGEDLQKSIILSSSEIDSNRKTINSSIAELETSANSKLDNVVSYIAKTNNRMNILSEKSHGIQREIDSISGLPILNQGFYAIADITFRNGDTTISFSQFKTITGNRLPKFKGSPFVQLLTHKKLSDFSYEVSKDSVRLFFYYQAPEDSVTSVRLLISGTIDD